MSTEAQPKDSIGWTELTSLKAKALEVLNSALDEGSVRDKMQAAILVKSMDDSNIKVEELRDKQKRLDSGMPTEISDQGTLGVAVGHLADQLRGILGNGAGEDSGTVKVVEAGPAALPELQDRAEPSDTND